MLSWSSKLTIKLLKKLFYTTMRHCHAWFFFRSGWLTTAWYIKHHKMSSGPSKNFGSIWSVLTQNKHLAESPSISFQRGSTQHRSLAIMTEFTPNTIKWSQNKRLVLCNLTITWCQRHLSAALFNCSKMLITCRSTMAYSCRGVQTL